MLKSIHVKNYKSLLDQKIELGRINIFIGENGSGKTNFLESIAMASAAQENRLTQEDLFSRGIRIARPTLILTSFSNQRKKDSIHFDLIDASGAEQSIELVSENRDDPAGRWIGYFGGIGKLFKFGPGPVLERNYPGDKELFDYCIYNLNVLALRGTHVVSRKVPLGIHGENLDVLISTFQPAEFSALLQSAQMVSWVDKVFVDTQDLLKFKGLKAGRSTSTLYFQDRFMRRGNNILSAENANDGILHILFYIALFISDKTPKIFGIDNIETALNPQLCRELVKQLAILAKERQKQALITTHNPAILDGLDLHDDDQRLFVVYRNDEGHTVTKRIQMKPDTAGKYKLSELWMRGHLGGLPRTF